MIRFVFLLKRNPNISKEECHKYWLEEHAAYAKGLLEERGFVKYVVRQTTQPDLGDLLWGEEQRGKMAEPFDGMAELWLDISPEEFKEQMKDAKVGIDDLKLLEDEKKFIDVERSTLMVLDDHTIIDKC